MPARKLSLVALLLLPLAAYSVQPHVARLVGPFHESEADDDKVSG